MRDLVRTPLRLLGRLSYIAHKLTIHKLIHFEIQSSLDVKAEIAPERDQGLSCLNPPLPLTILVDTLSKIPSEKLFQDGES